MREQGHCNNCKYPVERERIIRPVRTENYFSFYEPDGSIQPISTYETFHYYADGKEVITCPGCGFVLLTGDRETDKVRMELAEVEVYRKNMT